ncbi:MAG: DUF3306 domain-containing protein [Burkholderiales bacterium]|nr:DUF3306 domain-containing protein [Burkholderiales bacterium]
MAEGFFSRWSQRKEAVRKGRELPAQPLAQPLPPALPAPVARQPEPGGGEPATEPVPPPPTLADTHTLTPDSDFTRFARPDVAPEVKNAALRKLFADPHFNAMDGLDVYIDDYNRPDPLPRELLRRLASAEVLGLVEGEREKTPPDAAPADEGPQAVAQSGLCNDLPRPAEAAPPAPAGPDHADPDLRLQQDDAPGRPGPGTGPG